MGIAVRYLGITFESGRASDVAMSAGAPVGFPIWWLGAGSAALGPKPIER
jgi:hypothetical protein